MSSIIHQFLFQRLSHNWKRLILHPWWYKKTFNVLKKVRKSYVLGFFLVGILALFWDFVERFGYCSVLVKMGKGGIFHVFWGFVFSYVPFCFAGCMVDGIFGLVKERRDFWGSILKACSEVVWGLRVGVERNILFFYATFCKCNLCYFFLEGIIIYLMYHVNGYPI